MQNQSGGPDDLKAEAAHRDWGSLAHELCNLVQVVSGYLEMLATRTEDVLSLGYIENAQAAADELTQLAGRMGIESEKIAP